MTIEDYSKQMSGKTTEALLQIVESDAKDYQLEALEAAKVELTARGISFKEGSNVTGLRVA